MSDEDPKLVEQLNKLLARESKGGAPPVPIAQIVQLFRIADPALRSRAARLVGRYISYGAFLQKRLQEEDHRVRANVIESLWGIDAPEVRAALRKAALDPHHRVRTNALIGLYRLGETKDVAARLIEQSRHNLQSYRVAAAWAMGATKDQQFRDALTTLTNDEDEKVRECAATALGVLNGAPARSEADQAVA